MRPVDFWAMALDEWVLALRGHYEFHNGDNDNQKMTLERFEQLKAIEVPD